MADSGDLENWIAQLMKCKQLAENDVKKLCDKVRFLKSPKNSDFSRVSVVSRRS
jgi:hypothetical protein